MAAVAAALFADLIPLYPVYAVMFADPTVPGAGLNPAQISALFIIWSVTSFVAEVPSGIVADRLSRRRLLMISPVITGGGFALWTFTPSFVAFAVGFVLWGVGGSLRSGTAQALLYYELDELGLAARYVRVAGRVRAAEAIGVLAGTALAGPLLAVGGYPAAGVAAVLSCLLAATAAWVLPETPRHLRRRRSEADDPTVAIAPGAIAPGAIAPGADDQTVADAATPGWRGIVGDARRHLRTHPVVRRMLVLVVALTWVGALDEYLPFLAESFLGEGDSSPASVAVLMLVVGVGDVVGGLAAYRRVTMRTLGGWLGVAALCLLAGAWWASGAMSGVVWQPAGMVLVAIAFGVFGWALVVADALLQDRLSARSRATVTSVAGVGEEAVAILAFASWALGSVWLSPPALFAMAATPYLVLSLVIWSASIRSGTGAMTSRASGR